MRPEAQQNETLDIVVDDDYIEKLLDLEEESSRTTAAWHDHWYPVHRKLARVFGEKNAHIAMIRMKREAEDKRWKERRWKEHHRND